MSPDLTELATAQHQQSGAGMNGGEVGRGGGSNQTAHSDPLLGTCTWNGL